MLHVQHFLYLVVLLWIGQTVESKSGEHLLYWCCVHRCNVLRYNTCITYTFATFAYTFATFAYTFATSYTNACIGNFPI
jgi:hypothetical protein